jgi:hypothetical protein
MQRAIAAVAAVWFASPANAALAPEYYELARAAAPHVVVVAVDNVRTPLLWRDHGECRVRGAVAGVERGERYHDGDAIEIIVPCAKPGADIPASGTVWQDMDTLKDARRARAFLNEAGALALDQFDILF